jgi:hypothetical protein
MRLTPILIVEGRKEDLRKKYTEKFKEYPETLDFILGISDLVDTNFKYTDFVLKNSHPNTSPEEVEDIIELVKEFNRFQQSLDVKDINKYDLDGLKLAIVSHKEKSKSQQKKSDLSGAEKIYEDSNILIVKPLTYEASCKYGAGTRWCTTMANEPRYFNQYTQGDDQSLYYIILKKFDRNNKFYKIAIHKTNGGEVWYDSTDERMSDREKEVFSLGAPKVIETVRNHWNKGQKSREIERFKKIFNFENYAFFNISERLKSDKWIGLEYDKSEIVGENHAQIECKISIDEDNIDGYYLYISWDIVESTFTAEVQFDVSIAPYDNFQTTFSTDLDDTGYYQLRYNEAYIFSDSNTGQEVFHEICESISKRITYKLKNDNDFMNYINDGKTVWFPNRSSYGYTFKRGDSGLIKQLVDYLDSDKKGTKVDFLTSIGLLDKKEIKGKPYYSRKGQDDWHISSAWRGQHSSFFNSAKLAGIVDYDKQGNKFILKKGPNFDKFKEGQLMSL